MILYIYTIITIQVHVGPLRPTSRGTVRLQSRNPSDYPIMNPNYFSTEQDRKEFRAAVRLSREIFAQEAFNEYRQEELLPGVNVQSDNQIDDFIRAHGDSAYHPSCTAKIGPESDPFAVLDSECKVYGVDGLRVVDASAMPSIVSGNLAAGVMMMAEKAADIIKGVPALSRSTAEVWRPKSLSTQR